MLGGGAAAEKGAEHAKDGKDAGHDKPALPQPALYLDMKPALVSNFADPSGGASYLQIEMQLMARDPHVLDLAKLHMPVIRNNLLLIMSGQKVADLQTRAGKEKLQQAMLESIQHTLDEVTQGHAADSKDDKAKAKEHAKDNDAHKSDAHAQTAKIEAVYFTGFVMQ
jgi:flagellar FliL protein